MKNTLSGLVLLSAFFYGCTQNITLELPKYENKVAVYCILKPTELPIMFLNLSQSYYSYGDTTGGLRFIHDAAVVITDLTTSNKDTLKSDSTVSWPGPIKIYFFKGRHFPVEGHHYQANINYQGKSIQAETTVPVHINIDQIDYTKTIDSFSRIQPQFHIHFKDQQGTTNSYAISEYDSSGYNVGQGNNYTSDIGLDGKQLEIITGLDPSLAFLNTPFKVGFTVDNLTGETANYLNDIHSQSGSAQDLLSQPVVVRSNVKGGLGIFGSMASGPVKYITVK